MAPIEDELDLRHYLDVLRRRKVSVILCVLVVLALVLGLSVRQTPRYRASAEVLLRGSTSEQLLGSTDVNSNATQTRINVATEIEYMESRVVKTAVTALIGYEPSVSIRPNGETEVVTVSVTDTDPAEAARVADIYASGYIDIRREQLIEELLRAAATVQAQVDTLEDELERIEEPIERINAILNYTTDRDERERVLENRQQIEDEIAPERIRVNSQLTSARSQLAQLDLSANVTQTGGAQLISPAEIPEQPFEPQPLRNGVLAVVVGLILGVGLAFLRETLDDRVRSKQDLERVTGWSVVGLIPYVQNWRDTRKARLISLEEPNSPAAEAYRTLRTSVQFLGLERKLEIIQVTSAQAAEGKSTTLANLGVALARAGNRVVLVDCDLRRPRLAEFFGLSNDIGLTSVLLGETTLNDAILPVGVEQRLLVLPSGPPPPNPSELLALRRTAELFDRLRHDFDIVLVDSPPVLPVTDAIVLARVVDGVLVVANATKTRQREVQRASELMGQVNAPVIGTVVNAVESEGAYGYYYGYTYGSGSGPGDGRTEQLVSDDRPLAPVVEPSEVPTA